MKTNYPIVERNQLLLKLFTDNNFNAKLIGDPNQPAIVIDETYAIAGYVHNKTYHFCDKPFGGTEIHSIHLSENPTISRNKIQELIDGSEKRKLYKIKVKIGQYYMWFNNFRHGHLYFSPTDVRYYFSYAKANDMILELRGSGFEVALIAPQV